MREPRSPNLLKQIRMRMGMTQHRFANMLGVTQSNVGHYELREQTILPEGAKRLIFEAAVRGHRVTYEDIYGVVDAPLVKAQLHQEALQRADEKLNVERTYRHYT